MEEKREALCEAFHVDHWREQDENKDKELGIGGGYNQYGILSEDEFLRLLKTTGKRVQKFHETPDDYKEQFYKIKYPKKDDGIRMLVPNEENPQNVDVGEDGEGELVQLMAPGIGDERKMANPDEQLFEIAKKRFNIDKDQE
jgi:hypothetical protein